VITDTDCQIEWVNEGFTNITGYTQAEATGRRLDEFLRGPETDQSVSDLMREHLERNEGLTAEIINYRKSGEKYWVSVEVQPVFSEAHELTNFIAIETDITARKLGESALIEANVQLNLALEGARLALWIWHVPTQIVYFSDMWSVMLGGPKRDTVIRIDELALLIAPEDIMPLKRSIVSTLKGDS